MKRLSVRMLAAAGLVLTAIALQTPASQGQGVVKAQYGDWQMSCDTPPGASFEQCAIIQNVTAEDQPNVGLSVIVLKTADGEARLLRVLAPLGVLLPNGLGLNVDGTNMLARVRYIVLPLAVPALITIGVLAFREAWNDFDLVLALTRTPGNRTLPYELFLLTTGTGLANNPGEAAFAILTLVPFIFVYLRIERYVVGGITAGAMK